MIIYSWLSSPVERASNGLEASSKPSSILSCILLGMIPLFMLQSKSAIPQPSGRLNRSLLSLNEDNHWVSVNDKWWDDSECLVCYIGGAFLKFWSVTKVFCLPCDKKRHSYMSNQIKLYFELKKKNSHG